MKSYKVVEFGKPMQKVEEPTPTPKGTEVVVRITAAGVCHSDVHLWEGYFDMGGGNKYSTAKTMNPPRIMGHEIVGVVEALGPDARGAKVGDKAVVYPWIGCGSCDVCKAGDENMCLKPRFLGVYCDGGYSDELIVPHPRYLLSLDGLDPVRREVDVERDEWVPRSDGGGSGRRVRLVRALVGHPRGIGHPGQKPLELSVTDRIQPSALGQPGGLFVEIDRDPEPFGDEAGRVSRQGDARRHRRIPGRETQATPLARQRLRGNREGRTGREPLCAW